MSMHLANTTHICIDKWALTLENLILLYANNKGTDKAALPRSLISVCVIRSLERTIVKLVKFRNAIF